MKLCSFCDTLYNLDKFIGVEVIDNSDVSSDVVSIVFRFEGDYLHSNDDEQTPYSFLINMTSRMLVQNKMDVADIESAYEESMHDVLKWAASEFIEIFKEKLITLPIDESYVIELDSIRRDIIKEIKKTVKENK